MNEKVEFSVSVQPGIGEQNLDIDQINMLLLDDFRALNLADIEFDYVPSSKSEAKSKGDAISIGAIIVSALTVTGFLPALVEAVKSWTLRREGRIVEFKFQKKGKLIEFKYPSEALPAEQHEKLIKTIIKLMEENE